MEAKLTMLAKKYPMLIGVGGPTGGTLVSFIDALDPMLRFAALVVGLLAGIVTLLVKWEEWQIKKLERRNALDRANRGAGNG